MKKILALAFFLVIAATAAGQIPATENAEEERPPVNQRLFFGGSFGLQFGTVTNIEVAPRSIWKNLHIRRQGYAATDSYTGPEQCYTYRP